MKKTLYTIAILFVSKSFWAQENQSSKTGKLDSVITAFNFSLDQKSIFTYDELGNFKTEKKFIEDQNGVYPANPRVLTNNIYSNGNLVSEEYSDLSNLSKLSRTYIYNGNITESIGYNESTNIRVKVDSSILTFSDQGDLINSKSYFRKNGNWTIFENKTFEYDEFGQIVSLFHDEYISISTINTHSKWQYTTNGKLQLFSITTDNKLNGIISTNIEEYKYEKNSDTILSYSLSPTGERLLNSKIIKIYEDGNLMQKEFWQWDEQKKSYYLYYKTIYTFNTNYESTQVVTNETDLSLKLKKPFANHSLQNKNPISTEETILLTAGVLQTISKKYYYYSTFKPNAVTGSIIQEITQLYPNPTDGILNITLPENTNTYTWQVYNLLGANVMEGEANDSEQPISVEGLQSGTYMLIVNTGETSQSYKFYKR